MRERGREKETGERGGGERERERERGREKGTGERGGGERERQRKRESDRREREERE